jgi:arsenical pump membrane protein
VNYGLTCGIIAVSVAGMILRPWGVKEVYPAIAGALVLVLSGLLPAGIALRGVGQGGDVYLFLAGMMMLAELAADQGLFAWAAGIVARRAGGAALRLFAMIYFMAVLVTVFLSNDATAVVFTPAVAAMARAVKAEEKLPFLLICAFVANAASFVLPISNPANLVIYGAAMPPLAQWLPRYGLASVCAVAATYLLLWFTQRRALRQEIHVPRERLELSAGGRRAGYGIIGTAVSLMAASAAGVSLGLPTFLAGLATAGLVLIPARQAPWRMLRGISWSILPLVAALFVMVSALDHAGTAQALAGFLRREAGSAPSGTAWGMGIGLGVIANLVNNLPAGLLAGHALAAAPVAPQIASAALIGVDIGPNLSVTGSLATILWLTALRREGENMTAWRFLRLGAVIMPPALLLALCGLMVSW